MSYMYVTGNLRRLGVTSIVTTLLRQLIHLTNFLYQLATLKVAPTPST